VVVETDLFRAEWTTTGARLSSLRLKRYRKAAHADSPPLDLVDISGRRELPIGIELPALEMNDESIVYDVDRDAVTLTGGESGVLIFRGASAGVEIEKEVRFTGDVYPMELTVRVRGSKIEGPGATGITLSTAAVPTVSSGWFGGGADLGTTKTLIVLNGRRLEQPALGDVGTEPLVFDAPQWGGFGERYFITVVVPRDAQSPRLVALRRAEGEPAVMRLEIPTEAERAEAHAILYFGPKDLDVLEAAAPDLERAIDFGMFWFVAVPLHRCLVALHGITGNYGLDIILVSTLIKLLFLPLTGKSMESMRAMQRLQPEMTKVRERYKDDPQRLQKEMMELYRRHHVNPLSGCLPMLLQIPVFVGLYNTLLNAIELRHAPFVLWISDLSAPERLMVAGVGVPMLAIAMGASMLVQQWMAPAAGDPTQRRMMMIMPVVFTFMFINFPSGLVLYWLVNNVLTIGQQYFVLNRTAQ
jgi:YidC/Oxa1 family membrane protein insertase